MDVGKVWDNRREDNSKIFNLDPPNSNLKLGGETRKESRGGTPRCDDQST